jgi:nitrate reductase NapE component
MKKEDLVKSKVIKFLIPLVIIWGVITIFKGGFNFGQWLYVLLH